MGHDSGEDAAEGGERHLVAAVGERERVLRYEVVSCRRLRCSSVLLLVLRLGEARLWYSWVAGVPQRVCIRGGEPGRR